MNSYIFWLLLVVVLSHYSEGPQHVRPLDSFDLSEVTGVFKGYLCSSSFLAPVLPPNEVLKTIPPPNEVLKITPPPNEVLKTILPPNEVIPAQIKCFKNEILFKKAQNILSQLNLVMIQSVKSFRKLMLPVVHGGKAFLWAIRIAPQCFQNVSKMYGWSLAENQVSVKFRCRLIALYLKQSCFQKHDFSAMVDKLVCSFQSPTVCNIFNWGGIFTGRKGFSYEVVDKSLKMPNTYKFHGGGPSLVFSSDELLPYTSTDLQEKQYKFFRCIKTEDKQTHISNNETTVLCAVPLSILAPKLTMKCIKDLSVLHQIYIPPKALVKNAQMLLQDHKCHKCNSYISLFKPYKVQSNAQRQQNWYKKLEPDEKAVHLTEKAKYKTSSKYQEKDSEKHKADYWAKKEVKFPPAPPSAPLCQKIMSDFCADTSPEAFEETGCAVCGKLTPVCEMEELSDVENISLLRVDGITKKARSNSSDPVKELRGPILAPGCNSICSTCVEFLEKGKMPILALANGLWVGEIPNELQDLTYAEQLLIARVRHNRCIVKVSSGMYKMRANAISFSNPMPKIYNVLPPPIEEMDEVLAFIYTGPCKPTKADFKRTPMLVRRLKVSKALHWLKLNHVDYYDCEISEKNLASYPEDGPPVVVDYYPSDSNKNPESTSVNEMHEEDGTSEGPCSFVVHGLTGEEFLQKL